MISQPPPTSAPAHEASGSNWVHNTRKEAQPDLKELVHRLKDNEIHVHEPLDCFPADAAMHDHAAVLPAVIVSPQCEEEVIKVLTLLTGMDMYSKFPVSVRSGGHGYSNEASCSGIMINLRAMTKQRISGDTLIIEPGCILGQLIPNLAAHSKAVPHGDCFGVGVGGHFLTAGWDIALARRYGLGCQSVIGGSVVLWDGSKVDVHDNSHPDLLYSMRGGAVAKAGVATELRLQLIDEPPLVSRCFRSLSEEQLQLCAAHQAFSRAASLPHDVSISFRFHYEGGLVCSFNVVSLLTADSTLELLKNSLGPEVASLMYEPSHWIEEPLISLRMNPATEHLAANPWQLTEVTPEALHQEPLRYWKPSVSAREMASSYLTSISYWLVPDCGDVLLNLYKAFQSVQDRPARERMYALVIQGGGRIKELEHQCAMPLGQVLARYELHWDDPKDEQWSKAFTNRITMEIEPKIDQTPGRPYRGDIWSERQGCYENLGRYEKLEVVNKTYDRRAIHPQRHCPALCRRVSRRQMLKKQFLLFINKAGLKAKKRFGEARNR